MSSTKFGLVVPFRKEAALFIEALKRREESVDAGFRLINGFIDSNSCNLVICGFGGIRAAAATELLIARSRPDVLLHFGTAGGLSPAIPVAALVLAEEVFGIDSGDSRFITNHQLNRKIELHAGESGVEVFKGRVLTVNEEVISSDRRNSLKARSDALCVDCESSAVSEVAFRHKIPFSVIRIISDSDCENVQEEFRKNLDGVGKKISKFVTGFVSKY